MSIRGKAYIAGIYEHPRRDIPDRTLAQIHAELALGAVADAGLTFPRELGALHHVALALPDEAAGLALRERLQALQIPVTEVMDQGPARNMLFPDNNGLLLEAAWSQAQPNPGAA